MLYEEFDPGTFLISISRIDVSFWYGLSLFPIQRESGKIRVV